MASSQPYIYTGLPITCPPLPHVQVLSAPLSDVRSAYYLSIGYEPFVAPYPPAPVSASKE